MAKFLPTKNFAFSLCILSCIRSPRLQRFLYYIAYNVRTKRSHAPKFWTFPKRIKKYISLPSLNISALDTRAQLSSFTRVSREYHARELRIRAACRARFRVFIKKKKKKESSVASIELRGPRLAADSQLRRERTCRAQNPTERRRRAADGLAVGKLWAEFQPAKCGRAPPSRTPLYAPGVRVLRRPCWPQPPLSLSLSRARARARRRVTRGERRPADFPARVSRGEVSRVIFQRPRVSFPFLSLPSFIPPCITRALLVAELSRVISDEFFLRGLHAATRLGASNRSLR